MAILPRTLALSAAASVILPRFVIPTYTGVFVFSITFAFLLVIQTIYSTFLWPYVFSPLRNVPGPKSSNPFLGEFGKVMKLSTGEPQLEYVNIPNDGLIRYMWLFGMERVMPTNAKTLQEALHTNAHIWVKPHATFGGLVSILGRRGLFFAEGDEHRHYRKQLLPAFAHRHLKNLVPLFWEKSKTMADKVAKEAGPEGKEIDISSWASRATLDIIGAAGFGYDFHAMEDNDSELSRAYTTLFSRGRSAAIMFILGMILPYKVMYWFPTQRAADIRAAHRTVQCVSKELIVRKRKELADAEKGAEACDILTLMLTSGEFDTPDSEDIARDQVMTFLVAGHETTSTAVSWAIHLLVEHPTVQTRLHTEIRNAFPLGQPTHMTAEALDALPFLRMFVSETFRFFPPVPLTMRKNTVATTLGGVSIPAGTTLVVVPWALHKDTNVWGPDATEFKPERWEDGKGGKGGESNYNLQTFLAGPRSYIGKDFSILEFKALLVALVGRFEFSGAGNTVEIAGGITARPKGGLKVIVREVPGW